MHIDSKSIQSPPVGGPLSFIHPKIINTLRLRGGLSDEEILTCLSYFERRKIRKKDNFLNMGEICQMRGYINKGCFRRYTINDQGKELIVNFALEDWWIGDLESHETRKPIIYNIQALEDSEVFCISHSTHDKLCEALPRYRKFDEEKRTRAHYATIKRLSVAQSTPEEKYLKLAEQYPEILQRVPMHYIASYLGIEPESLSRLRKRIFRKAKKS